RALGSAVNQREIAALALVRGSEQNIRIARVHDQIGHAGVFANLDETGPVLATVGGLVKTAIAAALPKRAGHRGVDDAGVARIDQDARDVLGLAQAHIAPGAAAILALIDAVPVGDAALVVVLAGAYPDDRGILRVDD